MLRRILAMLGLGRSVAPPAPAAPPPGAAATDEEPPAVAALTGLAVGLTLRDMERLRGVKPELVRVVMRARTSAPFIVAVGLRTEAEQRELVRQGKSRTMASRHLTGHAVDLYPITDRPIPTLALRDYREVVEAMRAAAKAEGVAMKHGYDWGWDAPHHELRRSAYP